MSSESPSHTDKDEKQQRVLLPKSTSSLSSTSSVKEPHHALFRAFNIWIIYDNIFDRVTPADKTALALTCRRLRQNFPDAANIHTLRKHLSRPDFLDVLRVISYDLPNHYVCEQCMYLHRDARRAQKKTKMEKWELITGHAADTAVVQKASEDFLVGQFAPSPMPELEPPCRRSTAIRASSPSSTPLYDAGLSSCTFASRLSSTRRTPLAGLTHRDVQLLLKRVRVLREQRKHRENEECKKPGPFESKAIEHKFAKEAPALAPAPAPGWKSWWRKFRKPRETSDKAHARGKSQNAGEEVDLERAVGLALRPFLVQREIPIPEMICSLMPALKYKFVPRVILVPRDSHDGKAGHRRAHFLLQTVLTAHITGSWNLPLCICPHQILSNNICPVWTQAKDDACRALEDEDRLRGTRNMNPGLLSGPTPEGVQNVRPPFRLQTAARCVVKDRHSRHDCHADHQHCQKYKHEEYHKGMNSAEREFAAAARACATARAQIEGFVVSSSCDRCPTDFVVQTKNDPVGRIYNDELVITVWQDFGPEAPVTDELWQSHVPGLFLQAEMENAQAPYTHPNTWYSGPSVSHSPGSVRALFEKGETAFDC